MRVPVLTALFRGVRKRCPHCGRGPIYRGWAREVGSCPDCGLVYERNPGDTWGWVIIGDRIPIALGIIIVYFRVGAAFGLVPLIVAFTVLIVALVWTAPNRWGLGIALHYLARSRWPDPSDPLPPN